MGNLLDTVTGRTALKEIAKNAEAATRRERELRESAEAAAAKGVGKYYVTISQLWSIEHVIFSEDDLNAIRRDEVHPFYVKTFNAAAGEDFCPAIGSQRSVYDPANASSLATNDQDSEIQKSRKRKLKETTIDGSAFEAAEVAHLIPYSASCANFYGPLVEAAVGGSLESVSPEKKKLRQLVLVHGQYKSNTIKTRMTGTGIKHCGTNMVRLMAQKRLFDFTPSLLLVPLLTIEQTLMYKGGKYDVLAVCTAPEVYRQIVLTGDYLLCSKRELETATATLVSFVKASAFTLFLADQEEIEDKLQNPEREHILKTKDVLSAPLRLKVPTLAATDLQRVAKLTFNMADKCAHQESDPFLLFVKAAVVWSFMQDQKLLPGCTPPHDCDLCLAEGLFECDCDTYDPNMPIPEEIYIPSS